MTGPAPELLLLGAAVVVGLVQLLWATLATRGRGDLKWAAGPRDEPMPVTGGAGRLKRSFENFMETFPLHAAVVIVTYLAAKLGDLTLWGGVLYAVGRAFHPIFYLVAIPFARTLAWALAFTGTLMVTAAVFL
ncbi:MAPEG family protein [Phenylobacterium sp.]|uniref:MAPEG family protein n=1 Tax=Phenylobacterium sp. TaxID=1871053 RepID=UPI00286B7908|nr:MAPEG family protein [Phenylobacterium sp.]